MNAAMTYLWLAQAGMQRKRTTSANETYDQTVLRLANDHGWSRFTACYAADYYRGKLSWTALCVALGVKRATEIADMR